jgi:hypothetical protein
VLLFGVGLLFVSQAYAGKHKVIIDADGDPIEVIENEDGIPIMKLIFNNSSHASFSKEHIGSVVRAFEYITKLLADVQPPQPATVYLRTLNYGGVAGTGINISNGLTYVVSQLLGNLEDRKTHGSIYIGVSIYIIKNIAR